MEQFGIKENGYKEMRGDPLKAVQFVLLMIAMMFAIGYIRGFKLPEDPKLPLLFLIIIFVPIPFLWYRASKNYQKLFESYTLTFEDQLITREQYDTPTVSILRNEVSEITKDKNGAFTIIGESSRDRIKVPAQVESPQKLEKLLNEIRPVCARSNQWVTLKAVCLTTALLTLLVVIESSKDKIILGSSAAILLIGMGYSIIKTQKDRNEDYRTKRGKWLILALAIPMFKTIYDKLF